MTCLHCMAKTVHQTKLQWGEALLDASIANATSRTDAQSNQEHGIKLQIHRIRVTMPHLDVDVPTAASGLHSGSCANFEHRYLLPAEHVLLNHGQYLGRALSVQHCHKAHTEAIIQRALDAMRRCCVCSVL